MRLTKKVARLFELERVVAWRPPTRPVCRTSCPSPGGRQRQDLLRLRRRRPQGAESRGEPAAGGDGRPLLRRLVEHQGVMVQGRAALHAKGPRFRKIRALLYRKYPQYSRDAAISESDSVVVEVIPTRVFTWGFDGAEGVGRGVATTRRACAAAPWLCSIRHGSSVAASPKRVPTPRPTPPSAPPRGESRGRPAATWDRSSRLSAAGVGRERWAEERPGFPGALSRLAGVGHFGPDADGDRGAPRVSRGALSARGGVGAIRAPHGNSHFKRRRGCGRCASRGREPGRRRGSPLRGRRPDLRALRLQC